MGYAGDLYQWNSIMANQNVITILKLSHCKECVNVQLYLRKTFVINEFAPGSFFNSAASLRAELRCERRKKTTSVWIWFVAFNGYLQKEMDRFKSFLYGIILHAVPLKCYFKYFVSMLIYLLVWRPNVNNGLDTSQNKAVNLGEIVTSVNIMGKGHKVNSDLIK